MNMKRGFINGQMDEMKNAGNKLHSFYVTYRQTKNIKSQKWGSLADFESVLDQIEGSDECIQGELPIERLIIYAEDQCFAYAENPLWSCVDDESEDSHVCVSVPYIAMDGKFGKIANGNI